MLFKIYTIIPSFFDSCIVSVIKRALEKNLCRMEFIDIKDYGLGNHHQVDDEPYGGGKGMIMRADVIGQCLDKNISSADSGDNVKRKIILTSPRGKIFDQDYARYLAANYNEIHLLTNRFEGIDQRVIDYYNLEEISIGNYILTGGEAAALVIMDSVTRLLKDVIKEESTINESFNILNPQTLEHDHYTKPAIWNNMKVPAVLTSGHHSEINKWRACNSLDKTAKRLKNHLQKKDEDMN